MLPFGSSAACTHYRELSEARKISVKTFLADGNVSLARTWYYFCLPSARQGSPHLVKELRVLNILRPLRELGRRLSHWCRSRDGLAYIFTYEVLHQRKQMWYLGLLLQLQNTIATDFSTVSSIGGFCALMFLLSPGTQAWNAARSAGGVTNEPSASSYAALLLGTRQGCA